MRSPYVQIAVIYGNTICLGERYPLASENRRTVCLIRIYEILIPPNKSRASIQFSITRAHVLFTSFDETLLNHVSYFIRVRIFYNIDQNQIVERESFQRRGGDRALLYSGRGWRGQGVIPRYRVYGVKTVVRW